ncbi:hypothetical protein FHG87_015099 [Trinorchestia longiramus]|nr:hypothetical protein FHG87_015099 [Trinorchestia longiramus]
MAWNGGDFEKLEVLQNRIESTLFIFLKMATSVEDSLKITRACMSGSEFIKLYYDYVDRSPKATTSFDQVVLIFCPPLLGLLLPSERITSFSTTLHT